jgi:hypothetical protein
LLISAFRATYAAGPLPRSVDLTGDFARLGLTPLDQGSRDVCSLFAITALAEFESAKTPGAPHRRLSEEFLIWAADRATGLTSDQAMFYKAVAGLNTLGICTADRMPYADQPDPNRKPSAAALGEARRLEQRWRVNWIKRWSVDSPLTDGQLAEIKQALANRHPVACGLRWPKSLAGYKLLAVPPTDQVFDGHSIALVGYADGKNGDGVFRFRNSSGPNWGQKGYGEMSYAYIRAYANDALWLQCSAPDSETPTYRFEAESLPVLGTQRCRVNPQAMNDFGARMWSGGEQLFCGAERSGWVELGFDVPQPGRFRLRMLSTVAPDFGVVRMVLDGQALPGEFDLYSGRVSPAGGLELGTYELAAGKHQLRVAVAGKNAASKGYFFGLDALDLIAAK